MSITDELRKYISGTARCGISPICEKSLANIADRIDAEYESACAEAYGNGVMSVPIALDESAWVELPKDADGVPIHVGDVMEYADNPTELLTVSYIELEKNGWWVFAGGMGRRSDKYRHYHAPTVEDVLREMHAELDEVTALYVGEVIDSDERNRDEARIFAEYAAKLRLAETEDA